MKERRRVCFFFSSAWQRVYACTGAHVCVFHCGCDLLSRLHRDIKSALASLPDWTAAIWWTPHPLLCPSTRFRAIKNHHITEQQENQTNAAMSIFYEYKHWWQSHGDQSGFSNIPVATVLLTSHTHQVIYLHQLHWFLYLHPPTLVSTCIYWHPTAPRTHSSSHSSHTFVEWGFWYSVYRNRANTRNSFI